MAGWQFQHPEKIPDDAPRTVDCIVRSRLDNLLSLGATLERPLRLILVLPLIRPVSEMTRMLPCAASVQRSGGSDNPSSITLLVSRFLRLPAIGQAEKSLHSARRR